MKTKQLLSLILFVWLSLTLSACQSNWVISLTEAGQLQGEITQDDVNFYIDVDEEEIESVPLGQFLYANQYTLVDQVSLKIDENDSISFDWNDIASEATINNQGEIFINGETYTPEGIEIQKSEGLTENFYSIMDIGPTVAYAMGLPPLPEAVGVVRITSSGEWDHAVMILLDGLQYEKLETLIKSGDLPYLGQLDMLRKGLTVYPPISTSGSAAFLTGAPPLANGVYGYGYRSTETTTLFDLAVQDGLSVVAIEGASLAFNLRNAETTISGDRDGDGYSDDNVYKNSLEVIQTEMPDLLYIHFHEIDDMGHSYGPDSSEYADALIRVDGYLAEIYEALPQNTFISIFADHGMHETDDGGNHGTLTADDLIIPVLFLEK